MNPLARTRESCKEWTRTACRAPVAHGRPRAFCRPISTILNAPLYARCNKRKGSGVTNRHETKQHMSTTWLSGHRGCCRICVQHAEAMWLIVSTRADRYACGSVGEIEKAVATSPSPKIKVQLCKHQKLTRALRAAVTPVGPRALL